MFPLELYHEIAQYNLRLYTTFACLSRRFNKEFHLWSRRWIDKKYEKLAITHIQFEVNGSPLDQYDPNVGKFRNLFHIWTGIGETHKTHIDCNECGVQFVDLPLVLMRPVQLHLHSNLYIPSGMFKKLFYIDTMLPTLYQGVTLYMNGFGIYFEDYKDTINSGLQRFSHIYGGWLMTPIGTPVIQNIKGNVLITTGSWDPNYTYWPPRRGGCCVGAVGPVGNTGNPNPPRMDRQQTRNQVQYKDQKKIKYQTSKMNNRR